MHFLKHLWFWFITCPIFDLLSFRDYHTWIKAVGNKEAICFICGLKVEDDD